MLLAVQHLVLSATMLYFHLHTRYNIAYTHVFSRFHSVEEETVIGSQHAEFML